MRVKAQLKEEPLYSWLQKEIQGLEDTNIMTDSNNAPTSPSTFSAREKEWPSDRYKLFQKDLRSIYDLVVKQHRNKCAHNLTSVQRSLTILNRTMSIVLLFLSSLMKSLSSYTRSIRSLWREVHGISNSPLSPYVGGLKAVPLRGMKLKRDE